MSRSAEAVFQPLHLLGSSKIGCSPGTSEYPFLISQETALTFHLLEVPRAEGVGGLQELFRVLE